MCKNNKNGKPFFQSVPRFPLHHAVARYSSQVTVIVACLPPSFLAELLSQTRMGTGLLSQPFAIPA